MPRRRTRKPRKPRWPKWVINRVGGPAKKYPGTTTRGVKKWMAIADRVNTGKPADDIIYNIWFRVHVGKMETRSGTVDAYAYGQLFTETGVPGMVYNLQLMAPGTMHRVESRLAEKVLRLATSFRVIDDFNLLQGKVTNHKMCEKLKQEITDALPALMIRASRSHFQKILEDHGMFVGYDGIDTFYFSVDTGEHPIPWASLEDSHVAFGLETKDIDGKLHQDESLGTQFRVMERLEQVREWRYDPKIQVFKAVV